MTIPPLHDWHRHHPAAHRIAGELLACRDVLNLRTRRLVPDVCGRFGVSRGTAQLAVGIARREVRA